MRTTKIQIITFNFYLCNFYLSIKLVWQFSSCSLQRIAPSEHTSAMSNTYKYTFNIKRIGLQPRPDFNLSGRVLILIIQFISLPVCLVTLWLFGYWHLLILKTRIKSIRKILAMGIPILQMNWSILGSSYFHFVRTILTSGDSWLFFSSTIWLGKTRLTAIINITKGV